MPGEQACVQSLHVECAKHCHNPARDEHYIAPAQQPDPWDNVSGLLVNIQELAGHNGLHPVPLLDLQDRSLTAVWHNIAPRGVEAQWEHLG